MEDKTLKILIVEDHVLTRTAIADRLEREPGMTVVGSTGDADQAVESAFRLEPDVVLMDVNLRGRPGFSAARRISLGVPGVRLIFVSAFTHDCYIQEALDMQAAGYVTKHEEPGVLVTAIRSAVAGERFFSPRVRERLVTTATGLQVAPPSGTRASTLTPREVEVLRDVAQGLAKKQIAARLRLSVKTVDRHCCNLMDKLNIHDRVELARFAIREGLVHL
ncbi:MAG: response regulator transcription factor [Phycisphaerales bacterium]|nr:MAG: response regulator transcription factor [Phycisphaerales bacterium]